MGDQLEVGNAADGPLPEPVDGTQTPSRRLDRAEETSEGELPDGRTAVRILLAVSLILLSLGVWSWTNRFELEAPMGGAVLMADELAELRIVDLGLVLPISSESDNHWVLSYGFAAAEPDGAWIVDLKSRIVFEARTGSPHRVELTFLPFVNAVGVGRNLQIATSAGTVDVALVDGANTVVVAVDGERRQIIDIGCSRVDSPKELGTGEDERTLCAKLLSVRVD